jgi:pimeloyl-ACP methyl ester carboxylesterase
MVASTRTFIARRISLRLDWRIIQTALLLLCLATLGLAAAQVRQYEAGITRQPFVLRGAVPLPVVRYTSTHTPLNVLAVVVHGYSANKEMMSTFGVDLARQGITTYTYDLPGHGASSVPYGGTGGQDVVGELVSSVGEVADYAIAHAPAPHPRLVLIGYSLGTIAVGEYALRHPDLPNLAATVLVAGILRAHPTTSNPHNLLVLSGQFDLPGINDISRNLIASGCAVPGRVVTSTFACDPTGATGHRERIILPGLDHISIVTAQSTHTAILRWLGAQVDTRIGAVPVNANVRLHWMLLGFLAAGLATFPTLALGAAALKHARGRSGFASRDGIGPTSGPATDQRLPAWRGLALLAGTLGLALVTLHLLLPADFWAPSPLAFLAQQVSADVATLLLLAGLLLLGAIAYFPGLRHHAMEELQARPLISLALAGLVALTLYLTLGGLSSFAWEGLTLYPPRLWRAGVYALLLLPYLFGAQVLVGMVTRRTGWRALADAVATLLLLVALVVAIVTNFSRLSYLGILLPVFALVLIWFIGFNAWVRRVIARPGLVIALSQTLLLAWVLAATLPLVR